MKYLIPLIFFSLLAVIFMYKPLTNPGIPGAIDWDEALFHHEAQKVSILQFHQFPFWNPYACGGMVLFGTPIASITSIFEPVVWLFDLPFGLKVKTLIQLIFGMLGMYLLSRHLRMGKFSAYLPSVIYFLSSYWSTTFAEGRLWTLSLAFIPWIFLFFLKSMDNKKYIIITAVFLTLLFFESVAYTFPYTVLFLVIYTTINTIKTKKSTAIKRLLFIFILLFLLSSISFFPRVYSFLDNPREVTDISPGDGVDLKYLDDVFLNKHHATEDWVWNWKIDQKLEAWYEYTFYIGIIPLLLFIAGLIFLFTSYLELAISSLIFLWLMIGPKIPLSLYNLLHKLPFFSSQHMPSRFVAIFGFLMAIIIGLFVSKIENGKLKIGKLNISKQSLRLFVLFILIIITLNLVITNSKAFNSFPIMPDPINFEEEEFFQIANYHNFNWNFNVYKSMLQNKGMLQCGVTLSYPSSRFNQSVIPKYYVIEKGQIPANYNHLPVLFYNNKNVDMSWLIQQEINELVNVRWLLDNKPVNVNLVFLDRNNQVPYAFPQNAPTKIVTPSRNLAKIDFEYELKNKIRKQTLAIQNRSFVSNFSIQGVGKIENNQTLIVTQLFVIAIQENLALDNKNISVTIYEDNKPVDKILNPDYKGEVYLLNNKGTIAVTSFSPNKIKVKVDASEADTLLINQNYFQGWHAKGVKGEFYNLNALPALDIQPGSYELTLYYRLPGFYFGALITIIGIIAAIILYRKFK